MDKYDEAIEVLVKEPSQTASAWSMPLFDAGGDLFHYCSPNKDFRWNGYWCGCLTQVHSRQESASSSDLTERIVADSRLHNRPEEIIDALRATEDLDERRRILAPYAEWQREMDATIRKAVTV